MDRIVFRRPQGAYGIRETKWRQRQRNAKRQAKAVPVVGSRSLMKPLKVPDLFSSTPTLHSESVLGSYHIHPERTRCLSGVHQRQMQEGFLSATSAPRAFRGAKSGKTA